MTKPRLPKKECCLDRPRCKRCPIRALAEGTLPPGYTVKRRRLVRLDVEGGEQPVGLRADVAPDPGTSGKKSKPAEKKEEEKKKKKKKDRHGQSERPGNKKDRLEKKPERTRDDAAAAA